MEKYLVGIDVGTTGTKTYLMSEKGQKVADSYVGYETYTPDTLTCEQNASELWGAVVAAVREVCRHIDDREKIVAISVSTQGGTLIPTDEAFEPTYNAIVWSDKSCAPEREKYLCEVGSADGLYYKSGWELSLGLPLLQIRRLHDRKPEIYEKTAYFLSVADFISSKMTGIPAVDLSNAGINQLTDINKCEYDPELCEFAKVKPRQLPELVRSGQIVGTLTRTAAKELNLSEKTVFVAGAHDQYAVALGAGLVKSGDLLIGSGTCWVVTAINDLADFSAGLSQSVAAIPGKWGSLLSLSCGGACLEWLRKNVMASENGEYLPLKGIDEKCKDARAASEGLMFYPFSGKLSEKKMQSNTRASFIGLDISHDRFDMALAIIEGVAFQIRWLGESFKCGISEDGVRLSGGAAKSTFWSQILADILNKPIRIPELSDLACVGAAIMAGVGVGVFSDAEEGCRIMAKQEKIVYPDKEKAALYDEIYLKYKHNATLIEGFQL